MASRARRLRGVTGGRRRSGRDDSLARVLRRTRHRSGLSGPVTYRYGALGLGLRLGAWNARGKPKTRGSHGDTCLP